MIRNNEVDKRKIVQKLMHTYPDSIVHENCILNFDETVSNFAHCVWRDFDPERQHYHFNTLFASEEDCERWMICNLDNLYEDCQNFINDANDEIED